MLNKAIEKARSRWLVGPGVLVLFATIVLYYAAAGHRGATLLSTFKTDKLIVTNTGADAVTVAGTVTSAKEVITASTTGSANGERLLLGNTSGTNHRASIQWANGSTRYWAMGNDINLNNGNTFFIYDWTSNFFPLKFEPTSTGWLRFGPTLTWGGIQYDQPTLTGSLTANGAVAMTWTASAVSVPTALGVTGAVNAGSASITGDISTAGFITGSSSATLDSCGAGAAIVGSNIGGRLTMGASTTCTVNFASAAGAAPHCWLQPEVGANGLPSYTVTVNGIVISAAVASAVYQYGCM